MGYYISIIFIGIVAGYIAGRIVQGQGFGWLINLLLGILGAALGSLIFKLFGFKDLNGLLGSIITASLGAVLILYIANWLKRK